MKKSILFLGLLFINCFLLGGTTPSLEYQSTNDTVIRIYLLKQDSLIKTINEISRLYDQSSRKIHKAILLETIKSDSLISSLNKLRNGFNQWTNTLNNTFQTGFKEVTNKIPEAQSKFGNIIGSIIGALLSGTFAIAIFVHGKRNDKKKENKNLFNYGEEIYTLIKNITINARKQVELFEQLVNSIKENPHVYGKYQHTSFNLLKRAQSFDTTRVFNTFQYLKLEKKSYIKFYSSVDFLLEEFTNFDNDYHKNNSEVITPFSNDFIKLRQEIFAHGTDYIELKRRESKTDDPLYQFLNDLIIKYYKSPLLPETVDIKYDFEMLIKPLKPELIEKYRDYDQANEILNLAKQAGDIYISITQINGEFGDTVDGQIGNLNNMIEKLEQIEVELKTKYAS